MSEPINNRDQQVIDFIQKHKGWAGKRFADDVYIGIRELALRYLNRNESDRFMPEVDKIDVKTATVQLKKMGGGSVSKAIAKLMNDSEFRKKLELMGRAKGDIGNEIINLCELYNDESQQR